MEKEVSNIFGCLASTKCFKRIAKLAGTHTHLHFGQIEDGPRMFDLNR